MRLLLTVTILLVSTMSAAAQDAATAQTAAPPTLPKVKAPSSNAAAQENYAKALDLLRRSSGTAAGDLEQQTQETVLVVPTPELSPDALAAISEDMAVMCRILDKALPSVTRLTGAFAYGNTGDPFIPFMGEQRQRAQGLYLDGYGALFFVGVNFPLVAPPQEKTEAPRQESADRVWADAKNELRGQPQEPSSGVAGPVYDAQKVENLKTTLIKTLRHAANLRVRTPQDVIIVAAGTQGDGFVVYDPTQPGRRYTGGGITRRAISGGSSAGSADGFAPDPAATLILRVAKADVDAFASGSLTLEQFTPKVQVLWSAQPQAQTQETAATPSTPSPR